MCTASQDLTVILLNRLKNWTVFKSLTGVYYDSERQSMYHNVSTLPGVRLLSWILSLKYSLH